MDGKTVVTQSRYKEPHSGPGLPSHYQQTGLDLQENPDIPEEGLYPLNERLINNHTNFLLEVLMRMTSDPVCAEVSSPHSPSSSLL